ncbi:MAG: hypothetical protein WA604_09355 [Candidatus Sulfotelmatobacter sp.]
MRLLSLCLVFLAMAMFPQTSAPDGFTLWKGDAVKKSGEELATQLDAQKFGFKALAPTETIIWVFPVAKATAAPKFTKPKWTSG